jgi:purine-binding chemotaxis protein CheW
LSPTAEVEVLVFELGGRCFAVPLAGVREVFNLGPLTPVPTAPPAVAGVTSLRGQVLPVVDLALLLDLGLHRLRLGDPAVLVEADGVKVGLLVDRVVGLRRNESEPPRQEPRMAVAEGAGAGAAPARPLAVGELVARIAAELARALGAPRDGGPC